MFACSLACQGPFLENMLCQLAAWLGRVALQCCMLAAYSRSCTLPCPLAHYLQNQLLLVAMEFMPGSSLRAALRQPELRWEARWVGGLQMQLS